MTPRPYKNRHDDCLFYQSGEWLVCAKRCPVGAITKKGHDKETSWDHVGIPCGKHVTEKYGFKGYGCGLCQTSVPCENRIPETVSP
ncbi:MAG: hypothetical protein ABIK68_11800 [bacterium]